MLCQTFTIHFLCANFCLASWWWFLCLLPRKYLRRRRLDKRCYAWNGYFTLDPYRALFLNFALLLFKNQTWCCYYGSCIWFREKYTINLHCTSLLLLYYWYMGRVLDFLCSLGLFSWWSLKEKWPSNGWDQLGHYYQICLDLSFIRFVLGFCFYYRYSLIHYCCNCLPLVFLSRWSFRWQKQGIFGCCFQMDFQISYGFYRFWSFDHCYNAND